MSTLTELQTELQQLAEPTQKEILQRFFKTGKGEYGEGDIFLGIKVPTQRKVANKYKTLPLTEIQTLLQSDIHEYRLTALILLANHYNKADATQKQEIFVFYTHHTQHINNWDLVDISAPKIIGDYLLNKPRDTLYQLARSTNLWEKRMAIVATMIFIKHNDFDDTLKIAEILLNDEHDLIHKAVGWMLREVGKRDRSVEETFLNQHYQQMPRTMLRYAIEKFDDKKRKFYLKK
ncbi:MAG: DNA alkylation repair protein [Candidatus Parabeggiatoa sp. nov. 1]|nr:MAG: DNA alkylation repair protein [Gammaproteobacteria bacterium]